MQWLQLTLTRDNRECSLQISRLGHARTTFGELKLYGDELHHHTCKVRAMSMKQSSHVV